MTAHTQYEVYEVENTPHFHGIVERVPQHLQDRGDYQEWENWMVLFESFQDAWETLQYVLWLEENLSPARV